MTQPKIPSPARDSFKVGDRVRVFDRYLLALPCNGTVLRTEGVTEGCLVLLDKGSHGKADERFPDGIYVCFEQLRSICKCDGETEMTDKKTLSPAEALKALSEGKRLTHDGWKGWIYLNEHRITDENGNHYKMTYADEFYEYTEPTPKVVWVEYLCICKNSATTTVGHTSWYQDGFEKLSSWDYTPTGRKIEV